MNNSAGSWALKLLGTPQLASPGGQLFRCEGRSLALLTYLALEGATPRSRLADLLWPDGGNAGRNNLVQLLRRMGHTYGADLCLQGPVLALSPAVRVDARGLLEDRDSSDLPGHRAATPPDAPPLLDGLSFPDLPEYGDWLLAWRERLDALASRQTLRWARRLEEAGDLAGAARLLRPLVERQPLSEEASRALMRVQYLAGDAAGARRTFERCRDVLGRELRVEPMPATLNLLHLIERGEALTRRAPERAVLPPSVLRPPRLVGREAEWARMEAAWAGGQGIFLSGEPGVGKSRLAQDFLASRGRTLTLGGRPGDGSVPYASTTRALHLLLAERPGVPLSAAARHHLGLLLPGVWEESQGGPPEGPGGGSGALHAAIGELFTLGLQDRAGVFLDDVQYMDDASVEVMAALLTEGAVPGGGRGAVVAYRRGELGKAASALLRGLLASGRAVQLDLEPLGAGAVEALLEELDVPHLGAAGPTLGERLTRFTGGNPLFVLETVRQLLEQPGEGLDASVLPRAQRAEQLLARRLERLSRPALQAARAASVLEREFGVDLVAEMLGLPLLETASAWEELSEAQVVVGDRFSHDLLAETVLRGIAPSVRRLLHRAAARTLTAHGDAAARVAEQWLSGGREPEAAGWLTKAAASARSTYRPREAEAFYGRAAGLFDALGQPDEAFEALLGQVRMLYDLEEARFRHGEAVAALLARARVPLQHAQARLVHALLLFTRNDVDAMERAVREGLEFVKGAGDLRLEAELHEALAGAMLTARRPAEAKAALERLLDLSEQLGIVSWQAIAYDGLGQVAAYTSPREALTLFGRAEALCLSIGDLPGAASGANKQARSQHKLGRFREGLVSAERGQGYLSTLDGYHIRGLINVWIKTLCWQALGEHGVALAAIDAAQQAHGASESDWLDVLDMQRARLLLDLGELEGAREAARRVMASERFSSSLEADRQSMWAAVLTAQGRTAEALSALDGAEALLRVDGDVYLWPRLRLERAALLPAAQALPLLGEVRRQALEHGLRGLELASQVRLAGAHLALDLPPELPGDGDPDGAVLRGELLLTRARVLRWAKDARADAALADARTWLRETITSLPPGLRDGFLGTPLANAILRGGVAVA